MKKNTKEIESKLHPYKKNKLGYKKIIIIILSILIIGTITLFLIVSKVSTDKISTPNAIASLEKIKLGGVKQWLLIRGQDKSNPVLLYLHGGPGEPIISLAEYHLRELEKDFVVVAWEQRGSGKSYSDSLSPEDMNINQLLKDTRDLIENLLQRFPENKKIYLVGHSWGSIIGLLTAKKYPELLYAYVGVSQIINVEKGYKIGYDFALSTAREKGMSVAVRELENIGEPPYDSPESYSIFRKWLTDLGGNVYDRFVFRRFAEITRDADEYNVFDISKIKKGFTFSNDNLYEDLMAFDAFQEVTSLNVPVYFFEGKYDYFTPFKLVEEFVNNIESTKKLEIIYFERAGQHLPFEQPEKFQKMISTKVLEETFRK